MEKSVFNKSGMKMIINSGFKVFDNQTNYISTGNVISNTQYSNYIRPYNQTDCNGSLFKKGHLARYDLQFFHHLPTEIYHILMDENRTESYILYEFSYVNSRKLKDVIGYVITDSNYHLKKKYIAYNNCFEKRCKAIDEAIKYIVR